MKQVGHVADMAGKPKRKVLYEDLGVDGRILLKSILKKRAGVV
jgi:hypothetical protein